MEPRCGRLATITSGYVSKITEIILVLTSLDPHDLTLFGMYVWRLPVRRFHLYGRKPNQYSMDGIEENNPTRYEEDAEVMETTIKQQWPTGWSGLRRSLICAELPKGMSEPIDGV